MKIKRIIAIALCALTLIGAMPLTASAASVNIESETNSAADYLEYYSSGWNDLNTPKHWIMQTGEIVYCVQHKATNPHGVAYQQIDMSSLYSSRTLRGLQIIAENGYPAKTPSGFTADQARQATANAIRFWLSEEGDSQQYSFTNRSAHPTYIRAKSGYGHVLAWADDLLAMARAQALMSHNVSFSPASMALTVSGDFFVGTTSVSLYNCNGGYVLDTSSLPSGSTVAGYTGNNGDTLTIRVPKAYGNQNISLTATGYDNRAITNFTWFGPTSGNYQNVYYCSTSSGAVATAALYVSTPAYGKIQTIKTDSETGIRLAGAVLGVYSNSACTNEITRLTTNSSGTAITGDLIMGTYYVKEITAPTGYVLNNQVYTASVTTSTYTVTVPNTPAKGKIEITKTNGNPKMGNYSLAGAVFDIYSGNIVITSVTTATNGKGTSAAIPLGTYTVKERTAPTGYVLSKETIPVTLAYAGQTVAIVNGTAQIANNPQVGTITVTKADSETGSKAQGDATLNGAKYEIKDSAGKVVDTLHALGTRIVTSKELLLGTYTITEVDSPAGYLLNSAPKTVTLSYGGQNVEAVNESTTMTDTVKKGKISLIKFGSSEIGAAAETETPKDLEVHVNDVTTTGTETPEEEIVSDGEAESITTETHTIDNDPDIKPPLAGVVFEVRLKTSGELYDTLTTDADGFAESTDLPYGTYIVTETVGKDGYGKVKPFEVFVSENGKTYKYLLEDKAVVLMIKLVKQDAVTKKTIPIAGTTVKILDSSGRQVDFEILYPQPHTLSEFVTDESGTLYLPAKLPYGSYKLMEIKAPTGYTLSSETVSFNVNESDAENGVITVKLFNTPVMGTITVEKTGEMMAGFRTEESQWGTFYSPMYEAKGLTDVMFEVYAAENIGTGDGTVYYNAGDLVAKLTTDANGKATTEKLYLGKYNVVEKSVPSGYVLDTTPHEVILSYKDQNTAVVSEIIGIENMRQKASVQLVKMAEYFDYASGAFYDDYGSGFSFGLYTRDAIGDIPADMLVDLLITDMNGYAENKVDLPLGRYYLKELNVPDEYLDDGAIYYVDVTSSNNTDTAIVDASHVATPIKNTMYKNKVAIVKKDESNKDRLLAGATFEVLHSETKAVLTTFTTNDKGYGESCFLPCGDYLLRETVAPVGFKLPDTVWTVNLPKDSPVLKVFNIYNCPNETVLTKRSSVDDAVLKSATFQVFNDSGEQVFWGNTDENGEVKLKELPVGTYTFVEAVAPDTFSISDETYTFAVTEDGSIMGDTEIKNDPITVIVEKKDSYDKSPMAAVAFNLRDTDGNTVRLKAVDDGYFMPDTDGSETFAVDSDGKAVIKYLKAGNYSLVEQTPTGYVSADSYPLTVTDEHNTSNPYIALIYNAPTALKVHKVHEMTSKALTGAGFSFKTNDGLGFKTLVFTLLESGKYKFDQNGKETKLMVDDNGELFVIGLPLGDVWMEESVVPDGYFPAAPVKLTITKDHCVEEPLTITFPNSPFVKLGMDTDKYNVIIAIGLALAGIGVVTWRVLARRRNNKIKETEV